MEKHILDNSKIRLSKIGLGTWAIGGSNWAHGWGPQEDADSISAIHRALDLGINWIDTAPVYGLGYAEEIIGRALRYRRSECIIATKCGLVWQGENGKPFGNLHAKSIRKEAEDSLKRLGVDVIDLYQIHWPAPDKNIEEAWHTIADLIQEGKIRFGGVSNFNIQQLERLQAIYPITSLQTPYNMLNRKAEKEIFNYCKSNGISLLIYSPMYSGLLSGEFTKERGKRLHKQDWRKRHIRFREPELGFVQVLNNQLGLIAKRNGCTMAQLAIAWALQSQEVSAAIVGARNFSQIEETIIADKLKFSVEDIIEIDAFIKEYKNLFAQRQFRRDRIARMLMNNMDERR